MFDEKKYRMYLCGNVHCKIRGADNLLRALEEQLWALQLDRDVDVRVSGCQSRCDHGPNATVWPGPHRYAQLTVAAITQIVEQLRGDGAPVAEYLYHAEP